MNRNNIWKWGLLIFLVAWSLYEIYPPKSRPLMDVFEQKAVNRDATYTNIVESARKLAETYPIREYTNLLEAAGTNDLRKYFTVTVPEQADPNRAVLNELQREAAGKIRLGIDLRGGTQFLVELDPAKLKDVEDHERDRLLSQATEVLRARVDKFGVAEPVIRPVGSDRIMIQLPGLSEEERESARGQIERAAFLELRIVHPRSNEQIAEGLVDPGYERMTLRDTGLPMVVKRTPELTGRSIVRAMAQRDPISNRPEVTFRLDSAGAEVFARVTKANVGGFLAIVLDDELYSAPEIQEQIMGGNVRISGKFSLEEVIELANVLENPLETPVRIIATQEVDPSLGADSIASGFRATMIAMIAVAGFMLVYYLLAGVVANVALLLNLIILMGVMASVGATLTLPGIAGIVLTIGMAVDANVLIFERIREELKAGKSLRGSIAGGYAKAFSTIFDTNLTTLISSVILIYMGTGPIKGFGVTLTIGVAVSMFTALVGTRLVFDFMTDRGLVKGLPMLRLLGETKIDFLRWAKPAFVLSWVLVLVGVGYGLSRGSDVLGVDFKGGVEVSLRFTEKVEAEQVRAALAAQGLNAGPQYQRELGTGAETLRLTMPLQSQAQDGGEEDLGKRIVGVLQEAFPSAGFEPLSVSQIGATVGKEIQKSAMIAVFLALLGILIYVASRYEFSFAVAAVLAIIHDVLMTFGWYFLTGRELNAHMIAAMLTIIGFSINDTIVIFDRIREDLKLGVRGSFKELINLALNQTLSRTIITSGTSFLAAAALYVFGGGVINDFAFTFMVGVVVGTYSTVYIASAVVLWWHKGERPKIVAPQTTPPAAGTVPQAA